MKDGQNAMRVQFETVYEAESDAIFRFCLFRVSDREQAIDIVQETFTRLWQTMSDGQEMRNTRTFLYTVAHRLIIDWYRKKKSLSLEAMSDPERDEPYEPFDESFVKAQELEAEGRFLIDAISKIKPAYRHAVYMRFVEGLSPPEIGEVLGMSAGAASVRVNRGLEDLRKITGYDIDKNGQKIEKRHKNKNER